MDSPGSEEEMPGEAARVPGTASTRRGGPPAGGMGPLGEGGCSAFPLPVETGAQEEIPCLSLPLSLGPSGPGGWGAFPDPWTKVALCSECSQHPLLPSRM